MPAKDGGRAGRVCIDHEEERRTMQGARRPGRVGLNFMATADPRYTDRASVTFNDDHSIGLQRFAR